MGFLSTQVICPSFGFNTKSLVKSTFYIEFPGYERFVGLLNKRKQCHVSLNYGFL